MCEKIYKILIIWINYMVSIIGSVGIFLLILIIVKTVRSYLEGCIKFDDNFKKKLSFVLIFIGSILLIISCFMLQYIKMEYEQKIILIDNSIKIGEEISAEDKAINAVKDQIVSGLLLGEIMGGLLLLALLIILGSIIHYEVKEYKKLNKLK